MIDLAQAAHAVHAAALERELLADIPLARAMALRADTYDGASLTLAAPLAPNVNDKGCAFGGSLASLMTLSGWGLIKLAVDARALGCDIYVQDSSIRYLAPVWQDFAAVARLAEGEAFEEFFATLAARGKGRLRVHCAVPLADGSPAATLDARFVAVARR
jgi:thioesterase domain-containing protein